MKLLVFVVAGFCAWTTQAHAQLRFCNRTNAEISMAVLYYKGQGWASRGWFAFKPGECGNAIAGKLNNRYYFYYAHRTDGTTWGGPGTANSAAGCVRDTSFEIDGNNGCASKGGGAREVLFARIDTENKTSYTVPFTHPKETVSFKDERNLEKACQAITAKLERPNLRSRRITIGHYTDIFTPPQTKSECTNDKDTGVPDISTCTTKVDNCASKWHGPFGSWGCIPGTTTSCTNIKICDTYKHYKKTMECDITFQLKLPDYIEKPVELLVDNSFQVVEAARKDVATALPIACAPESIRRSTAADAGDALAAAIGREIERRIRARVEQEAREWLRETAIQTIAAAIPSGGIGGGAVMSTKLATFVHRVYTAVRPIVQTANEVGEFAKGVGFSTACGWNEWHPW